MADDTQKLDRLRAEIDSIDTQIHDLLMRRADIVRQVAAAKGKAVASAMRPAREAEIARRLLARHSGPFPAASMVRIWREIISALTAVQSRFSVAVHLPDGDGDYWDIARDHFGVQPPYTPHLSPGAVLRAVADEPATVGVLPWPLTEESDPWWRFLLAGDPSKGPAIVARLPAIGRAADKGVAVKGALVVAKAPQDPTGHDRSFLALELKAEMSRARLLSRLGAAGFTVESLSEFEDGDARQPVWHLIEVDGFVGLDDPRIAAFKTAMEGDLGEVRRLGGYAIPPLVAPDGASA